jgi:hypothetical protein
MGLYTWNIFETTGYHSSGRLISAHILRLLNDLNVEAEMDRPSRQNMMLICRDG